MSTAYSTKALFNVAKPQFNFPYSASPLVSSDIRFNFAKNETDGKYHLDVYITVRNPTTVQANNITLNVYMGDPAKGGTSIREITIPQLDARGVIYYAY